MNLVKNVPCMRCACICDDIEVDLDGGQVAGTRNACVLGDAWLRTGGGPPGRPAALIDGQPAPLEAAVALGAEVLARADMPLITGLSQASSEAQRAAVHLTEVVGGVIDGHEDNFSDLAAQLVGKVTCTLGEIKNRADFIFCWGDPADFPPRFLARYVYPAGKHVPAGRGGRVLAVASAGGAFASADLVLGINPGMDFEVLTSARALLHGWPVNEALLRQAGPTLAQLGALLHRMKQARFGVFLYSTALVRQRGRQMNVAALLSLVAELNGYAKFVALPMRGGNTAGADLVLRGLTGHACGIHLGRGYPRSNAGEFNAAGLLQRGDIDAALLLDQPPAWAAHLARVPTLMLTSELTALSAAARVHITTAATGISAAGTVYRLDDVPYSLRAVTPSLYPSQEEVLQRIRQAVVTRG